MSTLPGADKRRILPRWRLSQEAGQNPDFLPAARPAMPKAPVDFGVGRAAEVFLSDASVGSAAELLSTATLAGDDQQARVAAEFIVAHADTAPATLAHSARAWLAGRAPAAPSPQVINDVARIRALLSVEPRNPMLWSDLARHFASRGSRERASRCMQTALALAPNHRWMLRTAARFFAHVGDPGRAHKLLATHPLTRKDPWLQAAELACAQIAGRPPRYWRQARDVMQAKLFQPLHTSELATAIGMMELESGAHKAARKYVQLGLLAPTENTLAQVLWAREWRHLKDVFELDRPLQDSTNAYEAQYVSRMTAGDLLGARYAAQAWSLDEPFAARPCCALAYVASLLDDHATTLAMHDRVRRLDGHVDTTLELNVLFSRLSMMSRAEIGQQLDTERTTRLLADMAERDASNSYHAAANLGLLLYRAGDTAGAGQAYRMAVEGARKLHNLHAAAMAAIFGAREAVLAGDPQASLMLAEATQLSAQANFPVATFYLKKVEALAANPEDAAVILSPASAEGFLSQLAPPPAARPFRIERTADNRAILWLGDKTRP